MGGYIRSFYERHIGLNKQGFLAVMFVSMNWRFQWTIIFFFLIYFHF